ncbi:MAG: DUF2608 domain-containing protein [Endozoicomonadaceae bacterium]|nr:DUF2608 domain-containing protein [Endozoicomonadaceae bacterium]
MKKKFSYIALIFFCLAAILSIAGCNKDKQQYQKKTDHGQQYYKTSTPGQFLKKWMNKIKADSKTVVFLDLDDTVFSQPPNSIIRSDIYYFLRGNEKAKYPEMAEKEIHQRIRPLLMNVTNDLSYQLTDKLLPEVINELTRRGVTVVGLTAREKRFIPVTLKWLKQLNIQFSPVAEEAITDKTFHSPVIVKQGVLFAGGNKKGDIITALLRSKKIPQPEQILFMDDRADHVNSVDRALTAWDSKIKVSLVQCTYPEVAFKPHNGELITKELLRHLADGYQNQNKTVAKLLQTDPYTRELIASQYNISQNDKLLPDLFLEMHSGRQSDKIGNYKLASAL